MRINWKKAAVLTMTGALALGSMTGCSKSLDGTKTVATVNDEEIKLGTLSFMVRYQQAQTAQMYEMYFGGTTDGMWETVADEDTGETYGEQTVSEVMTDLEDSVILRQHAEDYDVTVSDEEKTKIEEAAKGFMDANDEATITTLGTSQELIEEALELSYYKEKMYDPITKDVDTKVSDEEAAQTGITMIKVDVAADSTDSASEETDTETADPKEQAQQILDEILATADADMDAIAKTVDENLNALDTNFTTNPAEGEEDTDTVPQEVQDAVKDLAEGEVYGSLVETEDAYYIVRLDATFDKDATEDEKTTIVNDRKQAAYDETTEKWRDDSKISEESKTIKLVEVTDNDKYSFKAVETPAATTEDAATDSSAVDSSTDATTDSSAVDSGTGAAADTTLEGADAEAGSVDEAVDAVDEAVSGSDAQ